MPAIPHLSAQCDKQELNQKDQQNFTSPQMPEMSCLCKLQVRLYNFSPIDPDIKDN